MASVVTFPFNPDWVVAPGDTLRDCLDAMPGFADWDSDDFDWVFGIDREQMRRLLDGDEPIDEQLADKLELLTGVNARMWLALEHNYRVGLAAGKKRVV